MVDPSLPVDEEGWALSPGDHSRVIIHLDADCFYAQVEMVRDPSLRDKAMGVKQKNLMVTSNYVARSLGVKKSMWIKEAVEFLPDLILVDGSDLTHYRQFSSEITGVAQTFTPAVERLGLDENFVDVTDIVGDYIEECDLRKIEGHIYGDKDTNDVPLDDECGCGCQLRLIAGALVAKKLRQQIYESTGITCCGGVAHNKLLAKLVSGYYKPNQQTVLFPWLVHQLMSSLNSAKSIPGIGSTTFKTLEEIGIFTVKDLQNTQLSLLYTKFDNDTSKWLKDLSFGIDKTPVKRSGRPQSIGLEDAFRKVDSITVVQTKYSTLLDRLFKLLKEDGRIPSTLRVTVRKFDHNKKFGNRESRQTSILPSLFTSGVQNIGENTRAVLMDQIMDLFHRMVDTNKEYHLTLLGIAFTKFTERAAPEKSIYRFFKRKRTEPEDGNINEDEREKTNHSTLNSTLNDHKSQGVKIMSVKDMFSKAQDNISKTSSLKTSREITDEDTNKKKLRVNEEASVSGCDETIDSRDISSKSSSAMSDYRAPAACNEDSTSPGETITKAPHGIDQEVFQALPPDIQEEILHTYKNRPPDPRSHSVTTSSKTGSKVKPGVTLDDYFKRSGSANSRKSSREDRGQDNIKALGVDGRAQSVTSLGSGRVNEERISGENNDVSCNSFDGNIAQVSCVENENVYVSNTDSALQYGMRDGGSVNFGGKELIDDRFEEDTKARCTEEKYVCPASSNSGVETKEAMVSVRENRVSVRGSTQRNDDARKFSADTKYICGASNSSSSSSSSETDSEEESDQENINLSPRKLTEREDVDNKTYPGRSNGSVGVGGTDGADINPRTSCPSPITLQPPDGVDPGVFSALPREIQLEIVNERRQSVVQRTSRQSSNNTRGKSPSIMKYVKRV